MKYKVKAINKSGEKYEGEREADNKFALYDIIRKEGGTVLRVEEVKENKIKSFDFLALINRVKITDKIQFAKNLGVMIEAGLPMTRAISVMSRQTKSPAFKKVLDDLNANISRGDSLSVAMEKHENVFSKLFLSIVKAGEESGSLTNSLKSVGNQLEKAHLLNKKIRGAMIYPSIIILVMVAIGFLMMIYVVPTLSGVFRELNVELPLMTRVVIGLSDFLKNNILISLLLILILVAGFWFWKRTAGGKRVLDYAILRIPIIGNIVKETNSARTARTMSTLISSGVDILLAIKIAEDVVQNVFYKEVLKKAEVAIEKGNPISTVFLNEEKLYPAFVGEMSGIGEETGRLGEMFENIALYYENEVDQKTKDLSTIIEPFLMVFIGIAVGFFAVSMLSPIYSLVDAI